MTYEQIMYAVVKHLIEERFSFVLTGYQAAHNRILAERIHQSSFFIKET